MLNLKEATTEDLYECNQHLLATYQSLAKRIKAGEPLVGELRNVRRQIRQTQFELLLRNQKEANA